MPTLCASIPYSTIFGFSFPYTSLLSVCIIVTSKDQELKIHFVMLICQFTFSSCYVVQHYQEFIIYILRRVSYSHIPL